MDQDGADAGVASAQIIIGGTNTYANPGVGPCGSCGQVRKSLPPFKAVISKLSMKEGQPPDKKTALIKRGTYEQTRKAFQRAFMLTESETDVRAQESTLFIRLRSDTEAVRAANANPRSPYNTKVPFHLVDVDSWDDIMLMDDIEEIVLSPGHAGVWLWREFARTDLYAPVL